MIGNLVAVNSKGPIYESFFKQVIFKKYTYVLYQSTKFSTYYRTVQPNLTGDFGKTVTFHVPNLGDLLHQIIVEIKLPDLTGPRTRAEQLASSENLNIIGPNYGWINNLGSHIIENVELLINGVSIVKYTDDYTMIYTEEKNKQYQYLESMMFQQTQGYTTYNVEENVVYIPLYFWFCENISESLPLFLLENAKIEIRLKIRPLNDLVVSSEILDSRNTENQYIEEELGTNFIADDGNMVKFAGGRFYGQDVNNVALGEVYGHLGSNITYFSKYIDNVSTGRESDYNLRSVQLICQCIDIGNEEKTRIGEKEYTTIISQIQTNIYTDISTRDKYNIDIPLGNPITDIFWFYRDPNIITKYNNYTNLSTKITDISDFPFYQSTELEKEFLHQNLPAYFNQNAEFIEEARIHLHNLERQNTIPSTYRVIIPQDKRIQPSTFLKYIYWWRFGKEGTNYSALNMDKLNKISLESIFYNRVGTVNVHIIAKSINILKISGGMVGLLFDSP